MINKTITDLEEKIKKTESIKDTNKKELLKLVADLKKEITLVNETHSEDAVNITGFTNISANEAIRKLKNPKVLDISIAGMKISVEKFETSHPELVKTVNDFCAYLTNVGV